LHINNDVAPPWTADIPYDIRDDGMRDFKKARANCEQTTKNPTSSSARLSTTTNAPGFARERSVD
jgi:hypothetical protein